MPPGWAHATVSASARRADDLRRVVRSRVRLRVRTRCARAAGSRGSRCSARRARSGGGATRVTIERAARGPPGARAYPELGLRAGEPIYRDVRARSRGRPVGVGARARGAALAGFRAVRASEYGRHAMKTRTLADAAAARGARLRRARRPCRSNGTWQIGDSVAAGARADGPFPPRWRCPGSCTTRGPRSPTWMPSTASSSSTTRSARSCCRSRHACSTRRLAPAAQLLLVPAHVQRPGAQRLGRRCA